MRTKIAITSMVCGLLVSSIAAAGACDTKITVRNDTDKPFYYTTKANKITPTSGTLVRGDTVFTIEGSWASSASIYVKVPGSSTHQFEIHSSNSMIVGATGCKFSTKIKDNKSKYNVTAVSANLVTIKN